MKPRYPATLLMTSILLCAAAPGVPQAKAPQACIETLRERYSARALRRLRNAMLIERAQEAVQQLNAIERALQRTAPPMTLEFGRDPTGEFLHLLKQTKLQRTMHC